MNTRTCGLIQNPHEPRSAHVWGVVHSGHFSSWSPCVNSGIENVSTFPGLCCLWMMTMATTPTSVSRLPARV